MLYQTFYQRMRSLSNWWPFPVSTASYSTPDVMIKPKLRYPALEIVRTVYTQLSFGAVDPEIIDRGRAPVDPFEGSLCAGRMDG